MSQNYQRIAKKTGLFLLKNGPSKLKSIVESIGEKPPKGATRFAGNYNIVRHMVAAGEGELFHAIDGTYYLTTNGIDKLLNMPKTFVKRAADLLSAFNSQKQPPQAQADLPINAPETLAEFSQQLRISGKAKLRHVLGKRPNKDLAVAVRRGAWACSELLERVGHGVFRLTQQGIVLAADKAAFAKRVKEIIDAAPPVVLPQPVIEAKPKVNVGTTAIEHRFLHGDATAVSDMLRSIYGGREIVVVVYS